MSADSLKQMIIKTGLLYSKDIGVGVLTSIYILANWGIRKPMTSRIKSKRTRQRQRGIYVCNTRHTPPYERAHLCRVKIYTRQ